MAAAARTGLKQALVKRFGDAPEVRTLIRSALVFRRRAQEATRRLDKEGLTIQAGRGTFRHPLVSVEREMRVSFAQTLRALEEQTRRRKTGGPTKVEQLPGAPRVSRRAQKYLGRGAA